MSDTVRKVKNPLLSAAGQGNPFDNFGENILLMPVTPTTPAVLSDGKFSKSEEVRMIIFSQSFLLIILKPYYVCIKDKISIYQHITDQVVFSTSIAQSKQMGNLQNTFVGIAVVLVFKFQKNIQFENFVLYRIFLPRCHSLFKTY